MWSLFYLLFVAFIAFSKSSPVQKATKAELQDYRLPEGVIGGDIKYNLELILGEDFFVENTFTGKLELTFNILKNTSEIKIHAGKYLKFQSLTLKYTADEKEITLTNSEFTIDNDTEILTIISSKNLEDSKSYTLNFNYTAELITEDMYGFYKSTYTKDGVEVPLATTQFETTYARRAFPCFDEPSFKATFDIKIKHLSIYKALGNTVGEATEDPINKKFTNTVFVTTPKMSTYLIAFVVSDFTCSEALNASVPHQICSRSDTESARDLALTVGPQLLDALQEYTGIPYTNEQLTKIDQVAIPDFAAGAMENWGLATYRETGLLWYEKESTNRNKQSSVTVIAHELTHMWFGDLVTTHWWSDAFLNEGFARFFQYFAANKVPSLQSWELNKQFAIEQLQAIMQSDAQKGSTPLSYETYTQAQASSRFGSVSYNKGASIIRMVQHLMGAENFKSGINTYLTKNKFSNVKPTDLWTSLSKNVTNTTLPEKQTLESVMKNWVEKAGFPLLNVSIDDDGNVVVNQQRFYTDGSPVDKTEQWYVPITYTKSNDFDKFEDTSTKEWLLPDSPLTISFNATVDDWIILNNQQVGYYRVLYDDTLWNKITTDLNKEDFGGIIDLNRAQLVDDIYNIAKANIKSHADVLEFYRFLKQDNSYYPWYSAFTAFSTMTQRTRSNLIKNGLNAYILELMEALLKEVSFNEDKDDDQIYTLKNVLALTWACRLGQQDCIDNSIAAFATYKKNGTKPSKNLRPVIYCTAVRNSANVNEDWDFLWGVYNTSEIATEKATIATALGCARDTTVLTEYLKKSIDASSGIKQQDALSVFSAVYTNNPEGVDIAFDFLIANYKTISEYYGSMNSLNSLINGLTGRFSNQEQVTKLEKFLEDNAGDLGESFIQTGKIAVDNAKANIKLIDDFEEELKIYFKIKENSAASLEVKTAAFITSLLILSQRLLF